MNKLFTTGMLVLAIGMIAPAGYALDVGPLLLPPAELNAFQEKLDAGVKPTEAEYKAKILNYMENSLKDPITAQYKWSEPFKGVIDLTECKGMPCYTIKVAVLAKNGRGAYGGWQNWYFSWRNGVIHGVVHP